MMKSWIEYIAPPEGCDTTALAECLVGKAGPLHYNLNRVCGVDVPGCVNKVYILDSVDDTYILSNQNTSIRTESKDMLYYFSGNMTAY